MIKHDIASKTKYTLICFLMLDRHITKMLVPTASVMFDSCHFPVPRCQNYGLHVGCNMIFIGIIYSQFRYSSLIEKMLLQHANTMLQITMYLLRMIQKMIPMNINE